MLPKNSVSRTYLLTKASKAQAREDKRGCNSAEKDCSIEEVLRVAAAAKKKEAERVEAAVRRSGARTLAEKEAVRKRYLMRNERTTPMADYIKLVDEPIGNRELSSSDKAQNAAVTATFEITTGSRFNQEIGGACGKNKVLGKLKARSQCKRWSNWYYEDCDDDQLAY